MNSKNDAVKRRSGVLLHVSSLPGPFGIGVFGDDSKKFIDNIAEMGFSLWQVLPFNPIGDGNSPYASASAFAGNYLFIDPNGLLDMELVSEKDVKECIYNGSEYTVDYEFASLSRLKLLHKAFLNISDKQEREIEKFKTSCKWVEPYCLYMAIKQVENGLPWWKWDKKYINFETALNSKQLFENEMDFWAFVQYIFHIQWKEVKAYANKKGVSIVGDMPIYVSMDSADVWSNLRLFQINSVSYKPSHVAGVPPDYFSEDGQLWGNPLYDWDVLEKEGYKWWLDRVETAFNLFDRVRIDHFRAFASYWAIPADSKTAKNGKWIKGPGQNLFDKIKESLGELPIIAEDLGVFGDDVVSLLKSSGFPGMRVIQFGFAPGSDSTHLPHNYPFNSVAYVGTHDNNTLLGWLWDASPEERSFALKYCGFDGTNWGDGGYQSASCRKIIETVWRSSSKTTVISLQDMCGFGKDARTNIPGTPELNWRFRTTAETISKIDSQYFKNINDTFKR